MGTVSNKSMTAHSSHRKPILKHGGKSHHILQSNSKTSFFSRKSYDHDGSCNDATSARRHGSEHKSKRRRTSPSKKQIIEELRQENEMLREKIKITELYAKDIEDHFRD